MANRFEKAYPARYISSYVPIPFEQLYALGKTYADERKKAEEELTANLRKFGEFISPSVVDTENYYKATRGKLAPIVEEAAADPNKMKSAEFRSRVQSLLNSIDYSELSEYQQSAKNLEERNKAVAKLKAAGRYDPYMDEIDPTNWDTRNSGVMNDLSPLEYQSIREQVAPYAGTLKETDLGRKGGYIWTGVSPEATMRAVDTNWSSIRNTPIAEATIRAMQRRYGISAEEAEESFRRQAFTDAQDFAWNKRHDDPYAIAEYKNQLAIRAKQMEYGLKQQSSGQQLSLHAKLTDQYNQRRQQTLDTVLTQNPAFKQQYDNVSAQLSNQLNSIVDAVLKNVPNAQDVYGQMVQQLTQRGMDSNDAEFQASMILLQQDSIPAQYKQQAQSLMAAYMNQTNAFTKQAVGALMQWTMNNRLGVDANSAYSTNPFEKISVTTDGGELMYNESFAHKMWEDALNVVTQPVGGMAQQVLEGLTFNTKKINPEIGYATSGTNMLSPRSVVMDNPHMQSLAENAKAKNGQPLFGNNPVQAVKGMHLNRGTLGKDNFDIEERAAKGDFGTLAVSNVRGYIDQGDTMGIVVDVNIPMSEIKRVYNRPILWDSPENTLEKYGFSVSAAPDGVDKGRWSDGYVTVPMVISRDSGEISKLLDNAEYEKQLGTTNTKNAQRISDDEAMMNLNNWQVNAEFNK